MSAAPPPRRQLELRLKACQEALARQPSDPQRVLALASALADLGRTDDAVACLRQAAALELGAGHTVEAAACCREVLELLPGDEEARVLLDHLSREVPRVRDRRRVSESPVVVLGSSEMSPEGDEDPTREADMPPLARRERRFEDSKTEVDPFPGAQFDQPLASVTTVTDELPTDPAQQDPIEEETVKTEGKAGSPQLGKSDGEPVALRAPALRAPSDVRDPFVARQTTQKVPEPTRPKPQPQPAASRRQPPALPPASAAASGAQPRVVRRGPVLPAELIGAGSPRGYEREEFLFREGEAGDELFLLRQGRVELIKWERTPRRNRIEVLEAGACFGELALFGDGHRHLSARALSDVEVVAISRQTLREVFTSMPVLQRELRALYRDRLQEILLRTSPFLCTMAEEEAQTSMRRFRPLGLKADQVVIAEGAPAPGLFIVLLGKLRVSCQPSPMVDPVLLAVLGDGDLFGEISLLREQPTSATVQTTGFVQLLHLPVGECHRLLSAHPELVDQLESEARRRERVNRAIIRGAAFFDEARGAVVYHPRT